MIQQVLHFVPGISLRLLSADEVTFNQSTYTVSENAGSILPTIKLSQSLKSYMLMVTVIDVNTTGNDYIFSNHDSICERYLFLGEDYIAQTDQVSTPIGTFTFKSLAATLIDDDVIECTEVLDMNITMLGLNCGVTSGSNSQVVILDDDGTVS